MEPGKTMMLTKLDIFFPAICCAFLSSCTAYHGTYGSGSVSFISTGNLGIVQTDENARKGGIGSGFTGTAQGDRRLASLETSQPASISFADGTVITGTLDNTSAIKEVGNAAKDIVLIKALRDIWKVLIPEGANTVKTFN